MTILDLIDNLFLSLEEVYGGRVVSEKKSSKTKTYQFPSDQLPNGITIADRYEVIEELGTGGMGAVYKVFDKKLEEEVALKLLNPDIPVDEKTIDRFRNELKISRKIAHRNVCKMYDLGEDKNTYYITMEYIRGENLKQSIEKAGRFSTSYAISIAKQLCKGLAEAHRLGVIHRDLKPQNIMLDDEGNVRIMDFGIARSLKTKKITEKGIIIGTLDYISPEHVEGKETDHRADIYSLGIILYEMLTGKVPFEGDTILSIVFQHKSVPAPDPRALNTQIPETLSHVILKCMEKDREKRYQTVEEILSALESIEKRISTLPEYVSKHVLPPFIEEKKEPYEIEKRIFVARESELHNLDAALEEMLAGNGKVIFVNGEAGTGKTALVTEFTSRAQEEHDELIVVTGNCNAHTGVGDPYLPLREILGLLTGDVESRWAANAITSGHATRLWNLLPFAIQTMLEDGPGLIETFISGESLIARAQAFKAGKTYWLARLERLMEQKTSISSSSNLQQSDLFEQYTRVIKALARKLPMLIVLDDLQWADAGSIRLLFHLGRRIKGCKILIVGNYRPDEIALGRDGERHPLESVINEFKREFGETDIDLEQTEDRKFLDDFLDTEPNRLGAEFRDSLYQQTRGHALFTIELLRGMQEQGILTKDIEGYWVEGPGLDWVTLPARIEAVVDERINQLPEELRDVLTLASVEGEEFTAEVVAGIIEKNDIEMVNLLSKQLDKRYRLVEAQGIKYRDGKRLSLYRFRHILFQKYLYGKLDEVERAYRHEQVGNILESFYGEKSKEISVRLIRHFQIAGVISKTVYYLEKAGEQSLRRYAHQEAYDYLTKAKKTLSGEAQDIDPLKRARWELNLGEACLGLGRLAESRSHLQQAVSVMDRPVPTKSLRIIGGLLRQVMTHALHFMWPSVFVGRSREKKEQLLEIVRAYEHLSEICYLTQEKFEAIFYALRALNLAERAGPSTHLARNYAHMSLAAGVISQHALARKYDKRAQEIANSVDPSATLGYTSMIASIYYQGIGQWTRIEELANQAVKIFHQIGDWRRWELSLALLGMKDYFQGDFRGCSRSYDAMYRMAMRRGDKPNQDTALVALAISQLRLGKVDKARDYLSRVDVDAMGEENRYEKMCAQSITSLMHLYRNDLEAASEAGESALHLFQQSDPRSAALRAYPCVAEVFLTIWEGCIDKKNDQQKKYQKLAQKACKALNRFAKVFPIGQPSALHWQGLYDWLSGKENKARKMWRKSMEASEKYRMQYDMGQTHYDIGRHASGPEQKKHLSIAHAIFTQLQADYDRERVERAT